MRSALFLASLLTGFSAPLSATDLVRGDVKTFTSPHEVTERCVALTKIPDGLYTPQDIERERAFCDIDFYAPNVALCPKLQSTSPGTFIYDISSGPFAGNPVAFEREVCPRGKIVVAEAAGAPLDFKVTMNAKSTSATFSTASLLYYHFARYFGASAHVPVSVYRGMDRAVHSTRVSQRGVALSAGKPALRMNHAAWQELAAAENKSADYAATDELFTTDRERIYGVMLHQEGRRYGPEINGTRRSGWGAGQNRDFQQTAPYLALRSAPALPQAIEEGLTAARRDPMLKKAMAGGVSAPQMVFWMQDLVAITLLDYIFGQQDRVGNIDYVETWYWTENGELRSAAANGKTPPSRAAEFHPVLIRRTQLNDNDAGGKRTYANFAKETGMLEKLRHYHADTYRRLQRLATDFERQGPLYGYLRDTFGLTDVQLKRAVDNSISAAALLRESCNRGEIRFDVDAEEFLRKGEVAASEVECNAS